MLKKILKWTGIVLSCLIIIAIILYAVIYVSTSSRVNKVYTVNAQTLNIPGDSASFDRGKHIAENRGCLGCHGDNLAGGRVFLDEQSPLGVLSASNITGGRGGIHYSDADWLRVLRHGVNQQNKSVWFMPSQEVCQLSNSEMSDLISFVKNHPPVDNEIPQKSIKPLGRILVFLNKIPLLPAEMIDHNFTYKETVTPSVTAEYGSYLATSCKGCHGEQFKGAPSHGDNEPDIPNISATSEVSKWKDADFVTLMHTGKTPGGKQLSDAMPYKMFTYTDDELKAIHLYLQSMK